MTTVDEYLYKGKLFCELEKYADALKSVIFTKEKIKLWARKLNLNKCNGVEPK